MIKIMLLLIYLKKNDIRPNTFDTVVHFKNNFQDVICNSNQKYSAIAISGQPSIQEQKSSF